MENIEKNLVRIHQQIEQAAIDHNRRASDIALLAVSKKKPAADIREAYRCGQKIFGENYLQEAQSKMTDLADLDIAWHFIGPVQSNKTRALASSFHWVHCVDRLKIAKRLSDHRPRSMPPLNICIQVNADLEPSKSGIAPSEIIALAQAISNLPGLRLRGLMTIPAPRSDFESQCEPFRLLAQALADLRTRGFECDTLSMGMSHDMQAAIAEGSTLVRIGTAIFGERL
jgi:pyridoxal phosphate enzyme (YggS family)